MQRLAPLLLDLWRECCRHIEIDESVARSAPLLARRLPLAFLLVRRVDPLNSLVESVAASAFGDHVLPGVTRTEVAPEEIEKLVACARQGRVLHRRASTVVEQLPGLLPPDVEGDVIVGPLAGERGPAGFLVLVSQRSGRFTGEHVALGQALLEPFSVALENDRRLRALATQQAVAEADRRSLLSRLGRQDLQETIIGAEGGFRPVMERADLVAPSDVPVLILGETGSGKEVVARAIHQRSRRASGPFLRVNCGAIPAGLIDSELFGHERGSFTGAATQRKGWFERADRGTLFLDEVGELPLQAQVRLLRILQDGTFERVGGQHSLHVDVRIVAATHRDVQAMVSDRSFREDLWYRIAVFPIHLPPLRDRPEDIPALATHFALRAATRFGTPARIPTPEEMEFLLAYPWPGNVRELAAVIERAVILGEGRSLEVATAIGVGGPRLAATTPRPAASGGRPGGPVAAERAAFPSLDQVLRGHVESALARTRGRIEGPRGAAALLGVNPFTLRARMRKLGIDWRRFREV